MNPELMCLIRVGTLLRGLVQYRVPAEDKESILKICRENNLESFEPVMDNVVKTFDSVAAFENYLKGWKRNARIGLNVAYDEARNAQTAMRSFATDEEMKEIKKILNDLEQLELRVRR